jgi:hypothetical protein
MENFWYPENQKKDFDLPGYAKKCKAFLVPTTTLWFIDVTYGMPSLMQATGAEGLGVARKSKTIFCITEQLCSVCAP